MPGRRGPFLKGTVFAALSFIVVACHGATGEPPASSLGIASRSADTGENGKAAPSSPESADQQSADVTIAPPEAAAPATEMTLEDIKADGDTTNARPTMSTTVVSVEEKAPAPVQSKPEARPDSLIGSRRSDLRARLGTPALLRREPPAEFWQFAGDGCVLHVYLYETDSSERYEVTHVELLPRGGLDTVPPGCFDRMLLDERQKAG